MTIPWNEAATHEFEDIFEDLSIIFIILGIISDQRKVYRLETESISIFSSMETIGIMKVLL